MIIYALQDEGVSVGSLFAAGLLPGLLVGLGMSAVNFGVSKRRNYRGVDDQLSWREMALTSIKALPALLLPVLILGGMRAGWFTPTEASVVPVFYALVCGKWVYRTLHWNALPDILARSALLTASVLIIIGMSASFAWVLTIDGLPQALAGWMAAQQFSPIVFLLVGNVFLLLFGIFIEPLPGVMVLVPILAPVAGKLGVDRIHFAMVVIYNLTLGMITPPVGGLLFVTANVARALGSAGARVQAFLVGARGDPADHHLPAATEHLAAAHHGLQMMRTAEQLTQSRPARPQVTSTANSAA